MVTNERDERVSLDPLDPEDALRALLAVDPIEPTERRIPGTQARTMWRCPKCGQGLCGSWDGYETDDGTGDVLYKARPDDWTCTCDITYDELPTYRRPSTGHLPGVRGVDAPFAVR